MPDEASKSSGLPQIPWTTLAPVVTILTGLILAGWQSLDSPRPPSPGEIGRRAALGQNISARLWQDPVSLVNRQLAESAAKDPAAASMRPPALDDLEMPECVQAGDEVTIMPVVMLAGSYGQDVEFRSRIRFAVLTSLWTCGFAPGNSDYIGAIRFKTPGAESPDPRKPEGIVAGYEWCHPHDDAVGGDRRHVLALWINEADIGRHPLKRISQVFEGCRDAISCAHGVVPAVSEEAVVMLAGSSTTLKRIINRPGGDEANPTPGFKAEIFACTTTADDAALRTPGAGSPPVQPVNGVYPLAPGIKLRRTLATDGQMMNSIVHELIARNVLPGNPRFERAPATEPRVAGDMPPDARVVLISEYDTVYGRNLPLAFARAAAGKAADALRSAQDLPRADGLGWIDLHTYARGFDGRLHGEPESKSASSDKSGDKSKERPTPSLPPGEATEGLNQSDYLRRLALEIEAEDRRLRASNPGAGGVRAVGILGSDVYDKLMVLKALRGRLPETIFFTTDLDARLTQSKDWKVTRNLVIAAPYGLAPDPAHNEHGKLGVAPFRDSYQTSAFKAVQRAFGSAADDCSVNPVRLFEVGRSGAVPLSTRGLPHGGTVLSRFADRSWLAFAWMSMLAAIAVICGIIFKGQASRSPPPGPGTPPEGHAGGTPAGCSVLVRVWKVLWHNSWIWFVASSVATVLLTLWLAARDAKDGVAEPLAFSDGVSVWPTVGFRILGVLMGFHFLAKARRNLATNGKELTKRFFKKRFSLTEIGPKPEDRDKDPWFAGLKYKARLIFDPGSVLPPIDESTGRICPEGLWERYWLLTNRKVRRWRILLMAALYGAGGFFLFRWLGRPLPPVRGEFATQVEAATLILWVIVQIVLTFAVLDSLLQMTALIRHLNEGRSGWKKETLPKEKDPALEHLCYCELLDIRLIGARTEKVGDLFLFPFVIQAAGIAGRLPLIDNWSWPTSLVIVVSLNILFVIVSMFVLRLEAEKARQQSLSRLRSRLSRQQRKKEDKDEDRRRKAIEGVIAQVRDSVEGAFAPATQQPAIKWVLWLISTIGACGILQYMSDLW